MDIPKCYDPIYQAERLSAEQDRAQERYPVCSCCGHRIRPGERRWTLSCRKDVLTICEDCCQELEDSETTVEEEAWR